MELARVTTLVTYGGHLGAILPIEDMNHAVLPIRDIKIFLRGVARECRGPHRAQSQSFGMDEEFLYEFTFLREDLDPVAFEIANVNESIAGYVNADQCSSELFVGSLAIADLTQWYAVGSPASFEGTGVGLVHNDAAVEVAIRDVDFMGGIVYKHRGRSTKNCCVLVVRWNVGGMSDRQQFLSVRRKLQYLAIPPFFIRLLNRRGEIVRVSVKISPNPEVSLAINEQALFENGPVRNVVWTTP